MKRARGQRLILNNACDEDQAIVPEVNNSASLYVVAKLLKVEYGLRGIV